MIRRLLVLVACVMINAAAHLPAMPPAPSALEKAVADTVSRYWESRDLLDAQAPTDPRNPFSSLSQELHLDNLRLGALITHAVENGDPAMLKEISGVLHDLPPEARPAVQEAIAIGRAAFLQIPRPPGSETYENHFPGYGYGEPGYTYRRGKEVQRESRGEYWQYEEYALSKEKTHTLYVTVDLLGVLQRLLGLGFLSHLTIGNPQQMMMNGAAVIGYQATFTSLQSMMTRANRKYEVTRTWYELFRAKRAGWGSSAENWELCGRTYQILYEPTGEVFASQVGSSSASLPPMPGQPLPGQPYPGYPIPGQPYPGHPYPGQIFPNQPYPRPTYPGQSYPGFPYPGLPYPGQPIPGTF